MREATFQLLDPLFREEKGRGHKSLWTKSFAEFLFGSEGFTLGGCNDRTPILKMSFRKDTEFSVAIGLDS